MVDRLVDQLLDDLLAGEPLGSALGGQTDLVEGRLQPRLEPCTHVGVRPFHRPGEQFGQQLAIGLVDAGVAQPLGGRIDVTRHPQLAGRRQRTHHRPPAARQHPGGHIDHPLLAFEGDRRALQQVEQPRLDGESQRVVDSRPVAQDEQQRGPVGARSRRTADRRQCRVEALTQTHEGLAGGGVRLLTQRLVVRRGGPRT